MNNLLKLLPVNQIDQVFSQEYCDIDYEFLGFTDIYEHLSEIIPLHFTVIDLGCCYAPQCFYFRKHKKYIGVDMFDCVRFHSENTVHYLKTISEFIRDDLFELDLDETFAICSYVPSTERGLIRMKFKNVFVYYPSDKGRNIFSR